MTWPALAALLWIASPNNAAERAQTPARQPVPARIARQAGVPTRGADFAGRIAGISADGRQITVETPGATRRAPPIPVNLRLTEKTTITFTGVPLDGARLTEGYIAYIWVEAEAKDTAATIRVLGSEIPRRGLTDVTGRVVEISADGKTLTVQPPPRGRVMSEPMPVKVRITDKTVTSYSGVAGGAAVPTIDYTVQVWLVSAGSEAAAILRFTGPDEVVRKGAPAAEKPPFLEGTVIGVSENGRLITILVPPDEKGEEAEKEEVALIDETRTIFYNIRAHEARPAIGQHAQVWLEDGPRNAAALVRFQASEKLGPPDIASRVLTVSSDGKLITVLLRPTRGRARAQQGVTIADSTKLAFNNVPIGGAKPQAGYFAQIWLNEGSKDAAARITFAKQ